MDNKATIFRSLETIEERIQEKLTVEKLAESIHFSRFHFQRLFRETVGESVMRYVARRRISLAAQELSGTKTPVLEIALKYGYDSNEGFARSFRAYMGVSPTEYRKYHLSGGFPEMQKEEDKMKYAKTTGEITRELNGLVVQARETADFIRKSGNAGSAEVPFYGGFWECIAARTENMADETAKTIERIRSLTQNPDEISSRFMIVKALEDAVFQINATAFQARLTVSRAQPEHREAFEVFCGKYEDLSRNARLRGESIVNFLNELAGLIFEDMRESARDKIRRAAEQGKAAAEVLAGSGLRSLDYIKDEIMAIVGELEKAALEELTVSQLEDYLIRLDVALLAGETDLLRESSPESLFEGISELKEQIDGIIRFLQGLPSEAVREPEGGAEDSGKEYPLEKICGDMAFQAGILLFYLKGEVQKLDSLRLSREQSHALEAVCGEMDRAVLQIRAASDKRNLEKAVEMLRQVCCRAQEAAGKLGVCGGPVQFIAEEINSMVNARSAV